MRSLHAVVAVAVSSTLCAATAFADTAVEEPGDSPTVKVGNEFELGAILQMRYSDFAPSSGDPDERNVAETDDGWMVRRARFQVKAEPAKAIKGELYFDYIDANKKNASALKDAFIELKPIKRVAITVGQFKIPFSLMHLRSVAHLEVAENGPTDDLLVAEGFAGFDQGVMVTTKPLHKKRWLVISGGVFDNHTQLQQASPAGLVAGRATSEVFKGLQLGAGVAWRPRTIGDPALPDAKHPENDRYRGHVVGVDARYQYEGLHLQLEVVNGTRTMPWRGPARTFLGATFLGSLEVPAGDGTVIPALKLEMLDDDLQYGVGRRLVGTAAVSWWFRDDTRLMIEVEETKAQAGSVREDPFSALNYVDGTLALAQLQLKI